VSLGAVLLFELGIAEKLYLKWNFCILTIGTKDKTASGEITGNGTFEFEVSPFEPV
jgi:hypothetical protein